MQLGSIDRGTVLYIEVLAGNPCSNIKLDGLLHETNGKAVLLVAGDEFYEYCVSQSSRIRVRIAFFRGKTRFSFDGEVERALMRYGVKLTEIVANTEINVKQSRGCKTPLSTGVD